MNPQEEDLVRLKAGGPVMVVKFRVGELLLCTWYDAAGRVRRGTFAPHQLDIVRRPEPAWMRALARLSTRWPVVAVC